MKVSVIVRTYNRAYVVRDALESALNQNYRDFELIVVDDCSTDNTADIVRSLRDERISYLRHEQNRGVAAACNTGIEAAKGEVIAFLDSDDIWRPDYLKRHVRFLGDHPSISAVFADIETDDGGIPVPSLMRKMRVFPTLIRDMASNETILSSRDMYLCLLEEVPVKPSALTMRREAVARVGGFDEGWRCGEDWEFLLRVVHFTDFGYIDIPLVIQRHYADATHRLYQIDDKLSLLNLFISKKAILQGDPEAFAAVRRGISTHCKLLGWSYIEADKRFKALQTYLRGFAHTGQTMMLFRALATYLPFRLRLKLQGLAVEKPRVSQTYGR